MGLIDHITSMEKRRHERHSCEATVEWSYFNKNAFFNAKLTNYSAGGVYLETDHHLKPGTTIFLKIKMVPSRKLDIFDHEQPRIVSLGEVKWCIDLAKKGESSFGIGLSYPFSE
jgi:hypothetical protein